MIVAAEGFTLKMADAAEPQGRFVDIIGLQIHALRMRASPLQRNAASPWVHYGEHSALVRMDMEGAGVFTAAASDHLMARLFLANSRARCRLSLADFGDFSGAFFITELAYEARAEDELRWRIALQSAADIHFTPLQNAKGR